MIVLTQAAPTHEWDARKHQGRRIFLNTSGVMDDGHLVVSRRNLETESWLPFRLGSLLTNQHLEHGIDSSAVFYQVELVDAGALAAVSLSVNYEQASRSR